MVDQHRRPAAALGAWLAEVEARPHKRARCLTCERTEIADAVRQFADAKQTGRTHLSWAQFHREFLAANGMQIHYLTMMGHVRECLGIRTVK